MLTAEVNCTQTCMGILARFFSPFPSYKYVSPDCSFSALAADSLLAFRFNWFSQFLDHLQNCVCVINTPITASSDECILKERKGVLTGFSICSKRGHSSLCCRYWCGALLPLPPSTREECIYPQPHSERPLFFPFCS